MNVESLIYERVDIALSRLDLAPSFRTLLLSVGERHLSAQFNHYRNCPPPVQLPFLCCEANGATPKRAVGVASAWFLMQVAAHLLDKVEDQELETVGEGKLGPAVSMNLSTGMIFVAEWILNHLELDCVDAGASWDIQRAFQETVLSVCSGQHLDLSVEMPDLPTCWQIAEAKSGSAYGLACYVGARTATHQTDRLRCMENFGRHLGTIVQISDDIADLERDRLKNNQFRLSPFANAYLAHLGVLSGLGTKDCLENSSVHPMLENSLVLYLRLEALKYAELAKNELKQLPLAAGPRDQILAIFATSFIPWSETELRKALLVFLHSLSVVSLVWIGWTVSLAVQKPSIGAYWRSQSGVVYEIDAGHPSATLFQLGDRIVNIAGLSPTDLFSLSELNGRTVHVLMSRDGAEHEISVQVRPSSLVAVLDRMPAFLVALAFWLAGGYVLAFSRSRRQAILFFLLSQCALVALTCGAVSSYSPEWVKIGFHCGLLWLGALAVLLHAVFPARVKLKKQTVIGYGLILVTAVLSLIYMTEKIFGRELVPASFTWTTTITLFSLDLVLVVLTLIRSYRRSNTALVRNQVGIIALSAVIGIFPVVTVILIPQLFLGFPLVSINLAFMALLTLPIGYGFAIYRYRLIGVKETINRSLAFVLVGLILMGFYSLFYTLSTRLISPTFTQSPMWGLATTVFLAGLTTRLYGALTRFMNNILYGGWYDFRTVVQQTKNSLSATDTNRETIGATLCEVIGQSMRLETVRLLFPDGVQSRYAYRKPVEMDLLPEVQCGDFLTTISSAGGEQDDLIPWNQNIAKAYRLVDQNSSVLPKLLAQMRGKDGSILGVFFIGEKRDGEPFNDTDSEILKVVLHQARSSLENVQLINEIQARAKKITDLHRKVLQTRDEERKEIAQDLHDLVIQSLVGANYQLADLRRKYEHSPDETLLKVQTEVRESIGVLRQICEDLRPPMLDVADFFDVLRQRISEIEESSNFIVRVSIEGNEQQELSDDVKMCIYRMVQESLINIHKHACADHVEVYVEITSEQVLVMVTDNGIGFSAPENIEHLRLEKHQGLVGIKERIDAVNGTLTIQSSPGQGCVLAAQVPI